VGDLDIRDEPVSQMSDYDRANVGRVMREGDWFTARLLRLFHAADANNRARLARCFPEEAAAYNDWLLHGDRTDERGATDEQR